MQVKDIKAEGLKVELEITVPANDIKKQQEVKLQEVGKTVKMPGFRPGKVPMKMLEQKYGRAVMGEVLESVVSQTTAKVLKDKNIRPAMQPKIEVKEFDEGKDLIYKMEFEKLPSFTVMDLKGLKLERPVAKIAPKAVDEALETLAKSNQTTKPIEGDRKTQKGDIAIITFHGRTKDDNVAHEGMHAHGVELELGSNRFIPGFEDQLIGKKAGESIEVNVTFPKDYGAKELAGREAIFDTVIEAIHEAAPATIDDEFAKRLGLADVAALRGAVEQQMQAEYDIQSRMKVKRQLLDILDENHDFEIPSTMVEAEYKSIEQQIEAERKTMPNAEPNLTDEEKEELKMIAVRRVRLGLILSEVGNQNKVTVTDKELQRAVIMEAQKYRGQEKQVFEYYQKNRNALEMLRAPIFEEKVVELIFNGATITDKDVSVEELMAEEDEEMPTKAAKKSSKKSNEGSSEAEGDKKPAKPKAKKAKE